MGIGRGVLVGDAVGAGVDEGVGVLVWVAVGGSAPCAARTAGEVRGIEESA